MRLPLQFVGALILAVLLPSLAFAQASITGTVRDTSGAVLPGVTVEAASPALIERSRTVITDESGQYRIVDLRPGLYSVTFTLTGFTTLLRDDIQLQGQFVATVNADMRVGSLAETVTVTGESPIVDVQSIRRQTVVDGDTVKELPVARSYGALLQMNPAVTVGTGNNQDIQVTPGNQVFGGPGGRANEGRVQLDGLSVGSRAEWRRRLQLPGGDRQLAGSGLHHLRRPGRGGGRRTIGEHRAPHRRQHRARHLLRRQRARLDGRQQHRPGVARPQFPARRRRDQAVGPQLHHRRADLQGSVVVFRRPARRGRLPPDPEHVGEQECR